MNVAIRDIDVLPPHVQGISVQRARVGSKVDSSVSRVVRPDVEVKVWRVVKCEVVNRDQVRISCGTADSNKVRLAVMPIFTLIS